MNQEQIQYSYPEETSSGIYKITFENNSYYIGSASNIISRCKDHISKLKRGKHENPLIQNVFNKHQNCVKFDVLKIVEKQNLLIEEQIYLNENVGKANCLNICKVAAKPPSGLGRKHSEEVKKRLSEKFKGRAFTKEWREKIILKNKSLPSIVKRRMKSYNRHWKEIIILEDQRNSVIELSLIHI